MPFYELTYIARQDVSQPDVEKLTENFSEIIKENKGKVKSTEYWGLRTLAYKIKKNRKGHYTMLNIDAPAEAISEVERRMRIHDDVLRYMTIKVEKLSEEPSPMMRDDRSTSRRAA